MNALTIYESGRFETMQRIASAMVASGYFKDSKDIAQAVTKVMAGAEIGIPPFAAMTGIHIIQGKPALGANVIATLVHNDPRYNYRVKQCDDKACIIVWYEEGAAVGESGFTIDEAKRAGLTSKDNWQKYTSDMLFARAITRGARRFAPGIFGGAPIYTPDELGADIDADGYIDASSITASGNDFNQDIYPDEDTENAITIDGETGEIYENGEPASTFRVGDDVLVHGKGDEKPGQVSAVNGELIAVLIDGKEYNVKPERLTLVDMAQQPALINGGGAGAYEK